MAVQKEGHSLQHSLASSHMHLLVEICQEGKTVHNSCCLQRQLEPPVRHFVSGTRTSFGAQLMQINQC